MEKKKRLTLKEAIGCIVVCNLLIDPFFFILPASNQGAPLTEIFGSLALWFAAKYLGFTQKKIKIGPFTVGLSSANS